MIVWTLLHLVLYKRGSSELVDQLVLWLKSQWHEPMYIKHCEEGDSLKKFIFRFWDNFGWILQLFGKDKAYRFGAHRQVAGIISVFMY